jgi:hypothetical protein
MDFKGEAENGPPSSVPKLRDVQGCYYANSNNRTIAQRHSKDGSQTRIALGSDRTSIESHDHWASDRVLVVQTT